METPLKLSIIVVGCFISGISISGLGFYIDTYIVTDNDDKPGLEGGYPRWMGVIGIIVFIVGMPILFFAARKMPNSPQQSATKERIS